MPPPPASTDDSLPQRSPRPSPPDRAQQQLLDSLCDDGNDVPHVVTRESANGMKVQPVVVVRKNTPSRTPRVPHEDRM